MSGRVESVKEELRTDVTLHRASKYSGVVAREFPSYAPQYLLAKLPIIEWLPRYSPSWLLQDFMAGLTIGVMLIPQGLSYAKIATIPIEHGLYSSWVPAAVGVFMSTSKDLSTGPTSILGLLTSEIVASYQDQYTPAAIASAVALMVGIYSLIIGVLELGFLIDYISIPVLTGFISATALTIGFGQLESLIGLDDVPDGVFNQLGDALKRLPEWDGPTSGVGFGTIFILLALEKIGKKWGKKSFAIKYLSSSRAIVVLVIFTLVSYLVNKDREEEIWSISKVSTNGIATPAVPAADLISKVATRAIAPLLACTLEHIAVGKAFGRRNHYSIDQTQEFNYVGVTNIINSFFGAMPVGGAMSRTAVNSECNVKSPLSGTITAGFIILTLYVFSPALFWLPKATLAAIIIMAVIHLFGPLSLIWRYWRISLADFIACNLAFWLTIFISAEIGIGVGAAYSAFWTLIRFAFVTPKVSSSDDVQSTTVSQSMGGLPSSPTRTENVGITIPDDTVVVAFRDAVFYPNASRNKVKALEAIQLVYPSVQSPQYSADSERLWTVAGQMKLEKLRRKYNVIMKDMPLSLVVWDFTMVPYIDTTGITALGELKDDIHRQLGKNVQIRMIGMIPSVRHRFTRARWILGDADGPQDDGADIVYPSLERAVWDEREGRSDSLKGITSEKM